MSAVAAQPRTDRGELARRLAPTLLAGGIALAYLIVSPLSLDLAAHLLRSRLFETEGFGLWNNWWYGGHHTPGYSVLFPPLAAVFGPQLVGAVAAVGTAALFEPLARARFGRAALAGSLWFALGTTTDLFTGRLTFAFGLLPAVGTALALQRRRDRIAGLLAVLTALASPVAALFAALAAAAAAAARLGRRPAPESEPELESGPGRRRWRGPACALSVAFAALVPVLVLAVLFPEGGSEPFTLATLAPIPVLGVIALLSLRREDRALRAGIALYVLGCLAAYAIATPVGSNAARLGPLLAGPLAALLWWPRRRVLLAFAFLPLLYMQWQASVRDVRTSANDRATSYAYFQPLIGFLRSRSDGPFRVEIPFTMFHWEAYEVAPRIPLARGWERQLDIQDNHLFYGGVLSPATYERWLRELAVHYVAVAATGADYSAVREEKLIARGLPYLHLVWRNRDWRVFAVQNAAPLADPPARAIAYGPNSVTLRFTAPGSALVRVRFTPYWKLSGGPGCVAPEGDFTRVSARRAGTVRVVIAFALDRVRARSPRCS